MSVRKTAPLSQTHESNPRKNVFDTAPSSKSSPQPKRKPAWLDAPLPQFYDQELAAQMVKEGCYATLEEAYLEVPEQRLNVIRQQNEEYLMKTKPPIYWRNAPLPAPKK